MMIAGIFALTAAALFTGAALYINTAEHPARAKLDTGSMLTQWKPAYKSGFGTQASLAIISGAFGLIAAIFSFNWLWIVGSLLILLNWPFTLLFIMPVNKTLMNTDPSDANEETRHLLNKWAKLHAVRTSLGIIATVTFIFAL